MYTNAKYNLKKNPNVQYKSAAPIHLADPVTSQPVIVYIQQSAHINDYSQQPSAQISEPTKDKMLVSQNQKIGTNLQNSCEKQHQEKLKNSERVPLPNYFDRTNTIEFQKDELVKSIADQNDFALNSNAASEMSASQPVLKEMIAKGKHSGHITGQKQQ